MALPISAVAAQRVVADVTPPRNYTLPKAKLWKDGKPQHEALKEHFVQEGRLAHQDVHEILDQVAKLLKAEPTLLSLDTPITVVGDLHGQFYDLVRMLEIGGHPSKTKYIFLGDYVDRGCFSTETALYLFALKICYPENVYLLRGNHECRHLTAYFNFKIEVKFKYDLEVYKRFMSTFDCLPLAALLNSKFLCVHGGISPDIKKLSDIAKIDRFREPPTSGPMCDLLWADPCEETPENMDVKFVPNSTRGCSYFYGFAGVSKFLDDNKLLSVIRAHEAEDAGYRMGRKKDSTEFPTVITLFSAPNYLDVYNNKGAILKFDDTLLNIQQFSSSPHPYALPNWMNCLNWSLPFVAEKVTEILLAILNLTGEEDDNELDAEDEEYLATVGGKLGVDGEDASTRNAISDDRKAQIRRKIMGVAKMSKMFSTLREERETILQLKGLAPGNKVPVGLLQAGKGAIRQALSTFEEARKTDKVNERLPPPLEN